MVQQPQFSSGLELANVVVNSGLLQLSWSTIHKTLEPEPYSHQQLSWPFSLRIKFDRQPNCTALAFVTTPICTKQHLLQERDLVLSATLCQEFAIFDFLCSKGNPSFSIHRAAVTLFKNHFHELCAIKSQIHDSTTGQLLLDTPLIVTGHSLGGSVASLFTLWLLNGIYRSSKTNQIPAKLPLCITFGSPLLGDRGIHRAISECSNWSSCFLHVAANTDPIPGLFMSPFTPFGTYLFCSKLGCACVENPDEVLILLKSTRSQVSDGELPLFYYKQLVEKLNSILLIKGNSQLGPSTTCSFQAGLILQLEAIGVDMTQQQQFNILLMDLGKQEKLRMLAQRKAIDPKKKLNEVKKKMANLEWYKKDSKMRSVGYYDSYRSQRSKSDIEVAKHKKVLTNYWKKVVEDAEKKPQKEGAFIRLTWLYSGTNYRRMVEPLEIAAYYRDGGRNYRTLGRSKHFSLLEQWLEEDYSKKPGHGSNTKKKKSADSCFWAEVEEALVSCAMLKNNGTSDLEKESAMEALIKFQKYAMQQIENYAAPSDIVLEHSSFMKWWKEFQEIIDASYNSPLVNFMKNGGPRRYKKRPFF